MAEFELKIAGNDAGDGSTWIFNRDTAERDLTAFEFLTIFNMELHASDGCEAMRLFKTQPRLLRHFRRVPPT